MVEADLETDQTDVVLGADRKALDYFQEAAVCQHKHTEKFVVVVHQEQEA
tara:strand:- start:116 stop:265 length:150 start_codon:yes stop_codon:yes gene_type:complete